MNVRTRRRTTAADRTWHRSPLLATAPTVPITHTTGTTRTIPTTSALFGSTELPTPPAFPRSTPVPTPAHCTPRAIRVHRSPR
jgi:hypothetical protein